jgi:hypothetical protein
MKRTITVLLSVLLLAGSFACSTKEEMPETFESLPITETTLPETEGKMRLIVTQDGEVDDRNSLIHTLLYANEIDLEGIVQTSSILHYSGNDTIPGRCWPGTEWMDQILNAYASVYPNLIIHDPDYPAPDALRAITAIGNVETVNDMEKPTAGSELIKDSILKEDARPLYIVVGGGMNTIARALLSIEEEYKDTADWEMLHAHICENVILSAFSEQDSCYSTYILPNWTEMRYVDISGAAKAYGYLWPEVKNLPDEAWEKLTGEWMETHLEKGYGALLDLYVTWNDGTYLVGEDEGYQYGTNSELMNTQRRVFTQYDFLSEGDSPAWFIAIRNGLRSNEDLSFGGWYGRLSKCVDKNYPTARKYAVAKGEDKGISQWVAAIQSDFAMRAAWCVADSYERANHVPSVSVAEGLNLVAEAGKTITLHAKATDPDGGEYVLQWYQAAYADTYSEPLDELDEIIPLTLTVSGECGEIAKIAVPEDAKAGDTIHVILECIDKEGTNPRAYQRVILLIKEPEQP